jgi:hypothetical protein
MTILMDDPSTYLQRDNDVPCIMLSDSVVRAMDTARAYGVSIQVNGPDPTKGIRVVITETDARAIITQLPATTPWAVAAFNAPMTVFKILVGYFGQPQTMAKALGVATVGKAWRPDQVLIL